MAKELSWNKLKKYLKMDASKFFEMIDKAHPEWKVKSTLMSKKKAFALQVAKFNTEYEDSKHISEFVSAEIANALKSGKNKGKAKLTYNTKKTVYLPADKKTLTNHFKKLKQDKYKWLVSRGNLAGLKTYDFKSWLPMFSMFQGNMGSSDSITTIGIGGYEKGTIRNLIESLAKAHHGVKLDSYDKKQLKYAGLTKVKPVDEVKKTTKKAKSPAKKKTTKRKTPAKKKTTKRKSPAKKKTTKRKR